MGKPEREEEKASCGPKDTKPTIAMVVVGVLHESPSSTGIRVKWNLQFPSLFLVDKCTASFPFSCSFFHFIGVSPFFVVWFGVDLLQRLCSFGWVSMADCKKQGRDFPEKTHIGNLEMGTPLNLDVALPIDAAFTNPIFELCNAPFFRRGGPLKNLYSSPFGSMVAAGNTLKGKVWKICSLFEAAKVTTNAPDSQQPSSSISKSLLAAPPETSILMHKSIPLPLPDLIRLPGTEDRVVIYFTSLRGVRKTFQDCHSTRMIFHGLRVNLDERDLSMDVGYRKELQRVLGERNLTLPHVFVKGIHIGGAEVIRQMLENGELVKLIKGLPLSAAKPCEACNDVRFIPCTNCDGSRKVYDEDKQLPKRCCECNENGLVRCPLCCS